VGQIAVPNKVNPTFGLHIPFYNLAWNFPVFGFRKASPTRTFKFS